MRELYGVMAARGAAGGFVVTSGSFTEEAIEFANGRNVTLVDGPRLIGLIQQAKTARGIHESQRRQGKARRASAPEVPDALRPVTPFAATAFTAPLTATCPSCSSPMVRRVAKRGENAGKPFLGCTRFSVGCRGSRPWVEASA